ncbi:MAG: PP2C family protein-serine/threonine phosphatase [Shimia sp.]
MTRSDPPDAPSFEAPPHRRPRRGGRTKPPGEAARDGGDAPRDVPARRRIDGLWTPFRFRTAAATHVGHVREINEDDMLSAPDMGVWAIADGMGGHAAGDVASRTVVEALATVGYATSAMDLERRVMDRLHGAHAALHAMWPGSQAGSSGSTVASLLVHGRTAAFLWAGDSRVYRMRDGRCRRMTVDHSKVQELIDAGRMTPEQAHRSDLRSIITRAVGVGATLVCDIWEGALEDGDLFLLCSDGLTEYLSDADLEAALRESRPLQDICDALVARVLDGEAIDNVTLILVHAIAGAQDGEVQMPLAPGTLGPDGTLDPDRRDGPDAPGGDSGLGAAAPQPVEDDPAASHASRPLSGAVPGAVPGTTPETASGVASETASFDRPDAGRSAPPLPDASHEETVAGDPPEAPPAAEEETTAGDEGATPPGGDDAR